MFTETPPARTHSFRAARGLALDGADELAHILERQYLLGRELDPEGLLDSDDQSDMIEGVPALHVLGRHGVENLDLVVVEYLAEYPVESVDYGLSRHRSSGQAIKTSAGL